ncbi:MAG: FecR family protein [Ferruginibacter sp.]
MVNYKTQLKRLLEKSDWTAEERQWLLNFLKNSDEAEFKNLMEGFFANDFNEHRSINHDISEKLLSGIHEITGIDKKQAKAKLVRLWTTRMVSACIITLLAFGSYLLIKDSSQKPVFIKKTGSREYKNDVAPGGDKATLTLADGSVIFLDDVNNGTLAQQGNTKVIKLNGKLNYNAAGSVASEIFYNTIATPRGGQYQVELPDGSMVWLNAASSLRFPTAFVGRERKVEISGEVYFEIAKNKTMPFIVTVNGAEIKVTGTHFNVMAYDDELTLQTTLLEGAVNFVKDGRNTILRPGQQSQLTKYGQLKVLDEVDIEKIVAWKNGFFNFEGSDFATIAKQLSRWYDAEVVYDRKINDLFYAEIPRDTKLSDVLRAMELTGKVHFEIEGRKIIVLP